MKISIYSDLHTEYLTDSEIEDFCFNDVGEARIRVLAGDIGSIKHDRHLDLIAKKSNIPTVYVLGNHEYYYRYFPEQLHDINTFFASHASKNVHVLERDAVDIAGIRILGCTLWTDYRIEEPLEPQYSVMKEARHCMSDHRFVYLKNGGLFTPELALEEHEKSVEWLETELEKCTSEKVVVVTHHAPSARSIHPKFRGDFLNGAFVSDLEWLIKKYQPAIWIHGHLHHSLDYNIGATRIVCNPFGYARHEENPHFKNPKLVQI